MNRDGSGGDDLATAVARNFPTPKQRDWKGKTQRGTHAPMDGLCNTLDIEVFASSAFCRCSKDMLSTKEKIVDNALELKIKEEL